jgi:endonuclease/exonuclease/phosphatase (EEP) superfamily protein YafD
MRRRAGRALAWVLALAAAGVTGSRWVDLAWSPWVLMQSLVPFAVVLSLVALVGVLPRGSWVGRAGLAGLCVLVLAVQSAAWVPWWTADPPRPGTEVTVMAVNLYRGRADTTAVLREVRARGVDVLVLSEMRQATAAELRRAGVHRLLPYQVGRYGSPLEPGGTVIRSRLPLVRAPGAAGAVSAASPATPLWRHPVAGVRVGGDRGDRDDIVLRAVHPPPPVPGRVHGWRAALDGLARWAREQPSPLVVAGDFNASVDHPGLREFLAAGMRDAHEVAGAGRPTTWPRGRAYPAFVHIDHVLVRGLDVASVDEFRLPGSDHEAVVARLVVPTRP